MRSVGRSSDVSLDLVNLDAHKDASDEAAAKAAAEANNRRYPPATEHAEVFVDHVEPAVFSQSLVLGLGGKHGCFESLLGAGGVGCDADSISFEVVDGVVAPEEDVAKNEVGLFCSHEAQHATLLTLVLHFENVVIRVNLEPMVVYHEVNAGELVFVFAADLIHA